MTVAARSPLQTSSPLSGSQGSFFPISGHDIVGIISKRSKGNEPMAESRESGVARLVGAGDAIGAAAARRFAAGGYTVCVARRDAEKSRSVVQGIIASGGIAHAVSTDVRSEEAVQELFAQAEAELGPVEV